VKFEHNERKVTRKCYNYIKGLTFINKVVEFTNACLTQEKLLF